MFTKNKVSYKYNFIKLNTVQIRHNDCTEISIRFNFSNINKVTIVELKEHHIPFVIKELKNIQKKCAISIVNDIVLGS